ncbi:unnamed protein product [marine sediment metagenome]|uniref:Uncharacterized protein n=1 Tax=marine sediment metagenome TaxID=412755 RepID=X1T8V9_9ZZZZ
MKIERAIEIKETTGDEFLKIDPDQIDEADRLSIEALARLQTLRQDPRLSPAAPLPSETQE